MMALPLYQQIRRRFGLTPASHMTHINNLSGILAAEELRSYKEMQGQVYQTIANEDVQKGRARIIVPCTGLSLHHYVPLYFGYKTPMVAANQDKNEEILFLRFSLGVLLLLGVVITDGNARSSLTSFRQYTQISDLSILDIAAIHSVKYARDSELKRKKQAEILVPERLSFHHVLEIICYSLHARNKILNILDRFSIKRPIHVSPHWYFY